jgi:hypothetical protein
MSHQDFDPGRRRMLGSAGALLLAAMAPPLQAEPTPPDVNAKIVEFARQNLGKRVGDGECARLVEKAFQYAGARRFPPFGPNDDYVWGQRLSQPNEVQPGDVLQFRNVTFAGREDFPNGTYRTWTSSYDHHSAIVVEVKDRGRTLVVLHQNAADANTPEARKKIVHSTTLRLKEYRGGQLWCYRPLPASR